MAMDKIRPLSYVIDTDPVPEAVISASSWFTTETMVYEQSNRTDTPSLLGWYLAQGWTVVSTSLGTSTVGSITTSHVIYTLSRRKLQAERALNDLIADFTAAYNEGRSINDQRYDEIVAIYDVMLDKTEDEVNAVTADVDTFDTLVEAIIAALPTDFTTYEGEVDDILDDYGTAGRARINLQFDNELTKARSRLVTQGMFNTTVFASISAGIEETRSRALTELNDAITERTLVHKSRVYQAKVAMRAGVLAARDRLITIKQTNVHSATEIRNRVLSTMLSFMERRQDEYPGLDSLSDIASKIGFTDTGAVVAP